MNSKKIFCISVLILILSMTGCSNNSERAENDTKYIPCVSLEGNETYDVEVLPSLHPITSAAETSKNRKEQGVCLDSWVNDEGHCVDRYNRELLEKEYNRIVDTLEMFIESSTLDVKVNYECNEIIYYVDETTNITDLYGFTGIAPLCLDIQLLSGVAYEDVELYLKIIYDPTGEEMFNMPVDGEASITINSDSQGNVSFSGTELTEEEFEEKLNAMKK